IVGRVFSLARRFPSGEDHAARRAHHVKLARCQFANLDRILEGRIGADGIAAVTGQGKIRLRPGYRYRRRRCSDWRIGWHPTLVIAIRLRPFPPGIIVTWWTISRRRAGSVRKVWLLPVVARPVGQRRIRCVVQPCVPFRPDRGRIRDGWIDYPTANARSTRAGAAFGEVAIAYRVGADLSSLEVGEYPGAKVHVPFLHNGCVKYS